MAISGNSFVTKHLSPGAASSALARALARSMAVPEDPPPAATLAGSYSPSTPKANVDNPVLADVAGAGEAVGDGKAAKRVQMRGPSGAIFVLQVDRFGRKHYHLQSAEPRNVKLPDTVRALVNAAHFIAGTTGSRPGLVDEDSEEAKDGVPETGPPGGSRPRDRAGRKMSPPGARPASARQLSARPTSAGVLSLAHGVPDEPGAAAGLGDILESSESERGADRGSETEEERAVMEEAMRRAAEREARRARIMRLYPSDMPYVAAPVAGRDLVRRPRSAAHPHNGPSPRVPAAAAAAAAPAGTWSDRRAHPSRSPDEAHPLEGVIDEAPFEMSNVDEAAAGAAQRGPRLDASEANGTPAGSANEAGARANAGGAAAFRLYDSPAGPAGPAPMPGDDWDGAAGAEEGSEGGKVADWLQRHVSSVPPSVAPSGLSMGPSLGHEGPSGHESSLALETRGEGGQRSLHEATRSVATGGSIGDAGGASVGAGGVGSETVGGGEASSRSQAREGDVWERRRARRRSRQTGQAAQEGGEGGEGEGEGAGGVGGAGAGWEMARGGTAPAALGSVTAGLHGTRAGLGTGSPERGRGVGVGTWLGRGAGSPQGARVTIRPASATLQQRARRPFSAVTGMTMASTLTASTVENLNRARQESPPPLAVLFRWFARLSPPVVDRYPPGNAKSAPPGHGPHGRNVLWPRPPVQLYPSGHSPAHLRVETALEKEERAREEERRRVLAAGSAVVPRARALSRGPRRPLSSASHASVSSKSRADLGKARSLAGDHASRVDKGDKVDKTKSQKVVAPVAVAVAAAEDAPGLREVRGGQRGAHAEAEAARGAVVRLGAWRADPPPPSTDAAPGAAEESSRRPSLWQPRHPYWRDTLRGLNWDDEPRITPGAMVECCEFLGLVPSHLGVRDVSACFHAAARHLRGRASRGVPCATSPAGPVLDYGGFLDCLGRCFVCAMAPTDPFLSFFLLGGDCPLPGALSDALETQLTAAMRRSAPKRPATTATCGARDRPNGPGAALAMRRANERAERVAPGAGRGGGTDAGGHAAARRSVGSVGSRLGSLPEAEAVRALAKDLHDQWDAVTKPGGRKDPIFVDHTAERVLREEYMPQKPQPTGATTWGTFGGIVPGMRPQEETFLVWVKDEWKNLGDDPEFRIQNGMWVEDPSFKVGGKELPGRRAQLLRGFEEAVRKAVRSAMDLTGLGSEAAYDLWGALEKHSRDGKAHATLRQFRPLLEEREARRHFNSRHLSQAALKMQRGGMESAVAAAVGESADGIWHPLGARPLPPAALEPLQGAA